MSTLEIISRKRDGFELSEAQIKNIIEGFTTGLVADYQMSAFLMAVYLNGMTTEEIIALTKSMLNSGEIISWNDNQSYVDKHSTGGIGDKVSLILGPILAAGGLFVPMIAGRGLEHTGGTLDKLESIPGFNVNLSVQEFKKQVSEIGLAIIGQGREIVPADKIIYALRDVTGTVASLPLITGSIMSKKIAEGISHLFLDIKTGNGAFMKTEKQAVELADFLIKTGQSFGISVEACISSMDQPLGKMIGNSLEIKECIESLKDTGPDDLMELTHFQAARLFLKSGKVESFAAGIEYSKSLIASGKALDKFQKMVEAQGGDLTIIDNPERFTKAEQVLHIEADQTGYLEFIDMVGLGMFAVDLGAGRRVLTDKINPANGIEFYGKIGDHFSIGEKIATIHCNRTIHIELLRNNLLKLIKISNHQPPKDKLIREIIE